MSCSKVKKRGSEYVSADITSRHISRHILLLDDEKAVRDGLTRLLKSLGHLCSAAPTGEVLLDIYKQGRQDGISFDLGILDVKIVGGMGGIETMQSLKRVGSCLPLLSMSGYPVETLFQQGEDRGFAGHLVKPFRADYLSAEIERVCSTEPVVDGSLI